MTIRMAQRRAEELAVRYGGDSIPIDVEAVAERLGLAVLYDDLGAPEISGVLVSNNEGACIFIQRLDHPNRQRFSIAHEIGHHVLKHQFVEGEHVHVDRGHYISRRDDRSAAGVDPKEMEANAFAACMLMPEELVRERAAVVSRGQAILDQHVRELARDFQVSEQAMTIRLTKIGLL